MIATLKGCVMSLSDELREAGAPAPDVRSQMLEEVHLRVHQRLIDEIGPALSEGRVAPNDLRRQVSGQLQAALSDEATPLSLADRARLSEDIANDILGYGPIQPYLDDPQVSEIMVNGPDRIYIERKGKIEQTPTRFLSESHLRRVIDKIVGD